MSTKPIFVATHPRACSTAFERVFMTRRDILSCVHEPFGDAYYFGPERLSERYEKDEQARLDSGFSDSTYKTIFDGINKENAEPTHQPSVPTTDRFPPNRDFGPKSAFLTTLIGGIPALSFVRDISLGKRLLIKDMAQYWVPPDAKPASIAPSLLPKKRGVGTAETTDGVNGVHGTNGEHIETSTAIREDAMPVSSPPYPYPTVVEPGNPTVVPESMLSQFHFAFLIRHPSRSIPSYYRCTIPPLDKITGFYNFMPSEAGYDELRRVFDYLREIGEIGPNVAGETHGGFKRDESNPGQPGKVDICVIDADDLLDNPSGIIEAFCKSVGIDYKEEMLSWESEEDDEHAKAAFEKWKGFHEDAIGSKSLKPRLHKARSHEEEEDEWRQKYGEEGARVIRQTVDANVKDYEYLKQFALKV